MTHVGITAVTKDFNVAAAGKFSCGKTTMDYVDGGCREKFTFYLVSPTPRTVSVEVEAMTPCDLIVAAAISMAEVAT